MADEKKEFEKSETPKEEIKEPKFVCPFHIRVLSDQNREPGELKIVKRISDQVKVDKDTLVVSPVLEDVDLDAETQTYKDMCGLEYFKMMLAQGKAQPEDSHDDGAHSYDASIMPKTRYEAGKAADAANDVIAEVAKQLGIKDGEKVSESQLVELLSKKVAENMAAKAAAAAPGEGAK